MAEHQLDAGPDTVHWGWFEAGMPPILTIDSGDTVVISSLSGGPLNLPPEGFTVPPELLAIHQSAPRRLPGHMLTGPVHVRGAQPGDVLEIRIQDIRPRLDWGYTFMRPLAGGLPDDFDTGMQIHTALDLARGTARLPWGTELTLCPFFGVMGVAPPAGWGAISSIQPRAHGGNLDNKELVAGSTLYLPVHTEGALFSCGDGHGLQGDGEVCVTAIETALIGRFEFHLHKGRSWTYPRAETPTHLITMGMDADLDNAARDALRRMIDWVETRCTLSRAEIYMLLSLTGDLRITQIVNEQKGSHMMLDKQILSTLPGATDGTTA
ncbi:acetamidase/formamidase family protein [Puniceibacterium sp. IMCC21224]|uniref:acetamidase/formamidase family protein n=1 Tax=Puniceibacterium sp. IMCC21224 TaxID=1618204 RepID=UPI00064DC535|nr:acetamidase/formamidase family protein [Puniceibacterium sp. IMCC21224]KMK66719.1 putative acetamidase/formamidase [Puniceibacterium sp. IMCC21224]